MSTVEILLRSAVVVLMVLLQAAAAVADAALDDAATLSRYAGTRIRLFDPFARDAEEDFRQFLAVVPMGNQRPLPASAARDTAASLSMLRRVTAPSEPTYFVATYFHSISTAALPAARRAALRARYGEDLYPQLTCPVFASHAGADVAAMLSAASGLAPGFFLDSPGRRDAYHRLFLLTEVSHCGFLARLAGDQSLPARIVTIADLRALLEALGDHEATIVFRRERAGAEAVDEADVLSAARTLAMFIRRRESAYTLIPALTRAFERDGVVESAQALSAIHRDVDEARAAFRRATAHVADAGHERETLRRLAAAVASALGPGGAVRHEGYADDVRALLALFPRAVAIVLDEAARPPARRDARHGLITLPGAVGVSSPMRTASVGSGRTARRPDGDIASMQFDLSADRRHDRVVER